MPMEIRNWKRGDALIPDLTTGLFSMSEEDYHSDPCEKPSLSSTTAKRIVTASPYHAWVMHPRFGRAPEHSVVMDRGSLIHALILGQPTDNFVIIEAENFRTKAAQSMRDSARAEGKRPCLQNVYSEASLIAEEVHDDLLKNYNIELCGESEIVMLWVEEVGDKKVQCRARLDHLIPDGRIIDFKNCESAHPNAVARAIYNYGYDIQYAGYTSAFQHIFPDQAGREDFMWAFVETLPEESAKRSLTQIYRPGGIMREFGRFRWSRAVRSWAMCVETSHWPTYADGIAYADPHPWMVKEMESPDEAAV